MRSYTYDSVGNRRSTTADGIVTDSNYQVQSNRIINDSNWTYTLDPNGNLTQKSDSASLGVNYDYNTRNELENVSAITDPVGSTATYLYNALGQRTFKSLNGDNRRYIYGVDGKLLSESLVDSTIVEEYVYLNGQPLALLGKLPVAPTPPVIDTIVDDVAAGSPWTVKSSQSAYGGKYQVMTVASPYTDTYTWNWTAPVSGTYDLWTWWMRKPTDGTTTYYSIDGGYSVATVTHSQQTLGAWTYLGRYHLTAGRVGLFLEEWRHSPTYGSPSGGTLVVDAAHFKLISQDTGQEGHFNYVLNDHLGTPRAVTDWNGQIVWQATYDPFGAATVNADPDGNGQPFTMNLRFPGQYFDAETGLNYNFFRSYDPARGAYIESDPIGLAGGMSTYGYVGGNPVNATDALGLRALTACESKYLSRYYPTALLDQINVHEGLPSFTSLAPIDVGAITIGRDVYLLKDSPDSIPQYATLGHEILHVVQQDAVGLGAFVPAYFAEGALRGIWDGFNFDQGYQDITVERQAREMEDVIKRDIAINGAPCQCAQ